MRWYIYGILLSFISLSVQASEEQKTPDHSKRSLTQLIAPQAPHPSPRRQLRDLQQQAAQEPRLDDEYQMNLAADEYKMNLIVPGVQCCVCMMSILAVVCAQYFHKAKYH